MTEEEYINFVEKYKQLEDKCNRAFRVYIREANTAGLVTRKYKEHEAVDSILDVNSLGVDYLWSETWQYGGHDQGENFIPMEFILDDKYEEAIRNSIWVDRKKEIEKKTKDEAERAQRKLDERRALFEQLKSEFGVGDMSDEENIDFIFPRHREVGTEIKSLSEIRGTMPTIMVGDEITGISPFVGPTPETWELIRSLSKKDDKNEP